jgi:hypothetical protein
LVGAEGFQGFFGARGGQRGCRKDSDLFVTWPRIRFVCLRRIWENLTTLRFGIWGRELIFGKRHVLVIGGQ